MISTQSWKLDDRFDDLKISVYQPCSVATESELRLHENNADIEQNDLLENAATERLPWDSSGALVKIKQEPIDSPRAPASVTLSQFSETVNGDHFTLSDSERSQTVAINTSDSIFNQLSLFADANDEVLVHPSSSSKASGMGTETYSDAEGGNLCLTRSLDTPCPSKIRSSTTHTRYFEAERFDQNSGLLLKELDSDRPAQSRPKPVAVPEASKVIERVPSHKWRSEERELLCILYRWYRCGDDKETPEMISTLFNAITGLNLRHKVIKIQFRNHLCLYGAKACPELARVFVQTPFNDIDDRKGKYAGIHKVIQDEALKLEVTLHRKEDVIFESGRAARAKSDYTRRIYTRLVHSASRSSELLGEAASESHLQRYMQGRALLVDPKDEADVLVDAEETVIPPPVAVHTSKPRSRPHLAFRVFNSENRTVLKPFGFQAARFSHLNGLLQEDAPVNFPELFHSHAIRHLNHDGQHVNNGVSQRNYAGGDGESAFVSVFVNLLQALSNAPHHGAHIAVIDLNHPSLTDGNNKLHFAYDLLKELKTKNLVPRAKGRNGWSPYRGMCEYVRWGDWPAASFIKVFAMRELKEVVAGNTQIASLLRLDLLKEYSTSTAAKYLREQEFILDYDNARAMGRLAKTFGLCNGNATTHHITEFIRHLVEGWSIEATSVNDLQTLSDIAFQFAVTFGSERPIQETMGAFINGVREGMEGLKRWRPKRRS